VKDLFDRLLSLDIETTGTNPKVDKIWSVGVTGTSRFEKFINPTDRLAPKDAESVVQEMGNMNSFAKQQLNNGSFNPLKMAITAGEAIPPDEAISSIFKTIDKNSVIVIQNANFENRFISETLKNSPELSEIQKKMMYVPTSPSEAGRLLYTPPKVINAGLVASSSYDDFMRSGSEEMFQESRKSYSRMMSEYEKLFKTKDKGAFVVDLMDITKATYAEAAHKGFLSKKNVNIGTSVEFLARSLLDEPEKHTALSDADQQIKIFKKLMVLRDQLKTGKLGDESVKNLAKIRAGQSYDASRQFVSGIKNTLEEIRNNGKTRLIPHRGLFKGVEPTLVESMGPDGIEKMMRAKYSKAPTTEIPREALEHVLDRFQGVDTKGIPNKRKLIDELKGKSLDEMIEHTKRMEKEFKGHTGENGEYVPGKIARAIENYDKPFRGESIKDTAEMIAERARYQVTKLTPMQKKVGLAGIGIAAFGMMASSIGSSEEDFKSRKENEDKEITLQNTLQIYNKPIVYHGSGFADWNERTGHHRT
jgi:hypothetical protein